jgi:glycosyltransferase involved in cell wall biosynthesis
MTSKFSVSVIIPSYNRHEATMAAVCSALTQSTPPLEVIVVDDGSDVPLDKHLPHLEDERVRIIRIENNGGPASARQAGIKVARGDVLAFLDSDDIWLPHKLESQLTLLAASDHKAGPVAVVCGWIAKQEDGGPVKTIVPRRNQSTADFAAGCWFSPGSTLVLRRAIFDSVGPFDARLRRLEDYEWFLRFGLSGGRIVVEPRAGTIVSVGRRARIAKVREASGLIQDRLAALRHPAVNASFRRAARAYLALEMAKAAHNEGCLVRMGLHLLRSFLLKPRARLALGSWWAVRRRLPGVQESG